MLIILMAYNTCSMYLMDRCQRSGFYLFIGCNYREPVPDTRASCNTSLHSSRIGRLWSQEAEVISTFQQRIPSKITSLSAYYSIFVLLHFKRKEDLKAIELMTRFSYIKWIPYILTLTTHCVGNNFWVWLKACCSASFFDIYSFVR